MKPLQGFRVLSLAVNIPGPAAAARLRHFGAEVVKVEPPSGDQLAQASPSWYAALHEGIEVRRLNLKTAEGRAQLDELLAPSDLLLTSTRPAALKRLGLDWPTLAGHYPRLCQVAIIGYPPPDEEKAGHDLNYLGSLGLVDPPRLPLTTLADLGGAEWAASAALALLLGRERAPGSGGEPERYAQVSLSEAAAAFAQPLRHGLTVPGGFLGGGLPQYNVYQAADGWVTVAALELHFLQRLGIELGLTDITIVDLAEAFRTRSAGEWEAWAAERDLPIAAVQELPRGN